MLSQPIPRLSFGSPARQWSTSSPAMSAREHSGLPMRSFTKSTASWLLITSQIPSQARIKNSSPGPIASASTSGCAVMIWSFLASSVLHLYLRSPMARLRFRFPLTRQTPPISERKPPAASMRAFSESCAGLWSVERATAFPSLQRTARLSPALATSIFPSCTRATTAVQPAWILLSEALQSSSVSMASPDSAASSVSGGVPSAIYCFSTSIFFSISNGCLATPSSPSSSPSSPSASLSLLFSFCSSGKWF
mmetsp:Transcript_9563/g.23007  ORF Transcript_9563/g.23007 Transcript_9563/m.23007 type:complete len:251 (-) Transcript_9563:734-1486(-)